MVAISLDLREHSVGGSSTRRAEAAEIAQLTSFDICDYYTIGGDLLAAHPKKLLLGMLGDMQVQDPNAEKMKKGELVALVEESAAEHRYAPKSLNWLATLAEPVTAIDFDDEDLDEGELDDQDDTGARRRRDRRRRRLGRRAGRRGRGHHGQRRAGRGSPTGQ
jgi:hypothetical protein